jgi:iron-sulfur cluster assembly protein
MIASVEHRERLSAETPHRTSAAARQRPGGERAERRVDRYTLESLEAAYRSQMMITITDKGAEKVHEFLASQEADVSMAGLRVGVRGGGCSGFQYQLAFDEQRGEDVVFESHGLKLLVDGESLPFVRGSTIDYEESLQGAGFKVSNPNVVAACGCGSSFRVAEEEQVSAV